MKPRSFCDVREGTAMEKRRTDPRRFAWVLAAAAVLGVGAHAFRPPARAAQEAARIDSIAPTCASVGARVAITGIGFGAENVAIAVGGVPAQVVTATGDMAAFIVPAGAHLGRTTVTATNPGGHTGSIAFRVCDLLMPEAWGGEWKMTITYRNPTTNSVTATDDNTAFIRTGEAFGLAPAVKAGNCAGSVSDTHLEIQCSGQATISTCTLGTIGQVTADRTGGTINGSGMNTLTVTGNCGPLVNTVQTIQISGLRLSLNQDPFGRPTTLVKSFVPFAGLIGAGQ